MVQSEVQLIFGCLFECILWNNNNIATIVEHATVQRRRRRCNIVKIEIVLFILYVYAVERERERDRVTDREREHI